MDLPKMQLLPNYQNVLARFVNVCQADERVVVAFLVGSYAQGTADSFSDLDLYLLTNDEVYEEFCYGRATFIHRLGNPIFLEDFDIPNTIFFIFPDGAECELTVGRVSQLPHILRGPYQVLLDKNNLLVATVLADDAAKQADLEPLRCQIHWFWHDLSHFIVALGRGQLWWAHGQLGSLRLYCINLTRLKHDLTDGDVGEEGYFKVDSVLPVEQLAPLQSTYCPMEPAAMLQAVRTILRYYQEVARPLAQTHNIPYPADLERVMVERLEKLSYR